MKYTPFSLFVKQALTYPLTSPFLPDPAVVVKDTSYANGALLGTYEDAPVPPVPYPASQVFLDMGDGTVCDPSTRLMWVKNPQKMLVGASVIADNQITNTLGDWTTTTDYFIGDCVKNTGNNLIYACAVDNYSGSTSMDDDIANNPTWWRELVFRIDANNMQAQAPMSQADAIVNCTDLDYAGYSDWRLPTIQELHTLAFPVQQNPAIDAIFQSFTLPLQYWSLTDYVPTGGWAWYYHFQYGDVLSADKNNGYLVRPVRSY